MKSRTKYELNNETIEKLFAKAGLSGATDICPLGAGEFNAIYAAKVGNKEYALKIAPPKDVEVLTYEKNMMASEVYWYKRMREDTIIEVPEIYFYDNSCDTISSEYFIMEKLEGTQPDKLQMTKAEKTAFSENLCEMTASMHKVKNDKFGYIQMGLYDNWYLAVRTMALALLDNCKKKGHKSKRGEKLIKYIDKYKDILVKADCHMVNYDIWMPNIVAKREGNEIKYKWLDPERSFWGDRIADFVCLDMFHPQLIQKTETIRLYNKYSEDPIVVNRETNVRYGVMMGLVGLIMETEKYYRYTPMHFGWWRNVLAGKFLYYKVGFGILKSDE